MKNNYTFITDQIWQPIVGRKSPVLRLFLNYEGFYNWFKKRFKKSINNTLITFAYFKNGKIENDNFINIEMQKQIGKILTNEIINSPENIDNDIQYFIQTTEKLIETNKEIMTAKDPIVNRFNRFCSVWRNFGPAYIMPIMLEKTLERIITTHYKNYDETYSKLLTLLASRTKSELFKTKPKPTKIDNYFKKEDELFIDLLVKLINHRDCRKNAYEKAWGKYAIPFLKLLAEKTSLKDNLLWATPEEIMTQLTNTTPPPKHAKECLIYFNDKLIIKYRDSFSSLYNKISSITKNNELKGMVAFHGLVRGSVRVIMPNDPKKIKPGEILVTKMTTPDFVPIMRTCSGIITDEGGVTCHAAIISREFKKPCIIGTQFATRILKTGDIVEIDTQQGMIKRINKN